MIRRAASLAVLAIILHSVCTHLMEARKSYDSEDFQTTIALCKQAVAQDSTDAAAWLLLAKSYRAVDSLETALIMLKKSEKYGADPAKLTPEKFRLYLETGLTFLSNSNVRMALTWLKSAEGLYPENEEVLLQLAEIYHDLGRLDEAKARYDKISSLGNPALVSENLEEIARRTTESQALTDQAISAYRKRHYITAKTKLEQALELKPDNDDARYYLNMAAGHILFKKGSQSDLWDAIEAFGKATAIKGDIAEPHYWLARAYEKKDDDEFVNAIDEYRIALELDPESDLAGSIRKKIEELTQRKEKLDRFWGRE